MASRIDKYHDYTTSGAKALDSVTLISDSSLLAIFRLHRLPRQRKLVDTTLPVEKSAWLLTRTKMNVFVAAKQRTCPRDTGLHTQDKIEEMVTRPYGELLGALA